MTVQLTPYGYIELPRGYWAYMEKDYMDAWTGYIEKFDATSKIYFAAGLIQSPFEVYKDPMEWTKTLKIGDREFAYLLVKTNEIKRVIVSVGSHDFFDFGIKDEAEIDGFLKIIGKYRKGRCESCLNSRWTKGLRKSLEKRFGEK
ncbi:MAG: hypothetical protein IPN69_20555 [Acidobacteria bacterium]|nr:hypothetical protein [Acidobacteriota bacterium]